ncbi:membrane protein insertion efficiency factor YidD [Candidatus Daviesbacteria bacterium]|nr:membrane protein insertion efficiency factor YidD [Candidatus Daviesbacteria bacterium]
MKKIIIGLINFYQRFLSFDRGLLCVFAPGGACKYSLSCSEYTKTAIRDWGVFRGSWLGIKRIWRCR